MMLAWVIVSKYGKCWWSSQFVRPFSSTSSSSSSSSSPIIIIISSSSSLSWWWSLTSAPGLGQWAIVPCQGKAPRTQSLTMISSPSPSPSSSSSSSCQFWLWWRWWCHREKDITSFDGKLPLSCASNSQEQHDNNGDYDNDDENDYEDDDGKERETSDHLLESLPCPRHPIFEPGVDARSPHATIALLQHVQCRTVM